MPLNGSGTASRPAGTTGATGDTITASKWNDAFDDIYTIFNTARPVNYGGTGAATAASARANLGLVIGTNVQAFDQDLAYYTSLVKEADKILYFGSSNGILATATLTSQARLLLDDGTAASQRTTLGLGAMAVQADVSAGNLASVTGTGSKIVTATAAFGPFRFTRWDTSGNLVDGQRTITLGPYVASANKTLGGAHGIGGAPKRLYGRLTCTAATLGYAVGDVIFINHSTESTSGHGLELVGSSTSAAAIVGTAGLVVLRKDTRAQINLSTTAANDFQLQIDVERDI